MIRLYRIAYSTNVERVTLALDHKGIECDSEWIDPGDRSEVQRISGQPLVPVVEIDGEVVADSTLIIRRLEELHPEPALYPADAGRRAEVHTFEDWFNGVWKRPPNLITDEMAKPEPDQAAIERWGAEMRAALPRFDALLDGRPYLMGDEFSAADACAYPFLKYAHFGRETDDDDPFHEVLVHHQPLGPHPRISEWIQRVAARAS